MIISWNTSSNIIKIQIVWTTLFFPLSILALRSYSQKFLHRIYFDFRIYYTKISKKMKLRVEYLPGVPGRLLFFLVASCCCWLLELLLLQASEGSEIEPWGWSWCCSCCSFNWRTSSPVFAEEKLLSSPETFDIGTKVTEKFIGAFAVFCGFCFLLVGAGTP